MTDDELDEAILGDLRAAGKAFDQGQSSKKTRTTKELADTTGESIRRVKDRVKALEGTGHVQESQAAPDRWMITSRTA